jgi:hypothetical protein
VWAGDAAVVYEVGRQARRRFEGFSEALGRVLEVRGSNIQFRQRECR